MIYTLLENAPLSPGVFRLVFGGSPGDPRPGTFAQVSVPGLYLRRPISLCDWDGNSFTLVIREVGIGTRVLRGLVPGTGVDILLPLGNGFDAAALGRRPLLVGGGVGLPPLLGLSRALLALGSRPTVLCGFSSGKDSFLTEEFAALGCDVRVATLDGSLGIKGLVTDLIDGAEYDGAACCGPRGMMKAVYEKISCPGQYSFEERMACGWGACMGCAIHTRSGVKRVCADGPVFSGGEVIW